MDERKFESEMLKAIMRRTTQPERASYWKVSSAGCNGHTTKQHSGQAITIDSGCRLRRTAVMSRIANTGVATATGSRSPRLTLPSRPRRWTCETIKAQLP